MLCLVEKTIIEWSLSIDYSVKTYNLKFTDVSKAKQLLDYLLPISTSIQVNSPGHQSNPENSVSEEEVKASDLIHSEMAVDGLPHNTLGLPSTQTQLSVVQQSVELTDINLPETNTGIDKETEDVATHSQLNATDDDLPDTKAQQESCKNNVASGNEICNGTNTTLEQPMNVSTRVNPKSHSQEVYVCM